MPHGHHKKIDVQQRNRKESKYTIAKNQISKEDSKCRIEKSVYKTIAKQLTKQK
jgi:hypothetical protein